MNALDGLSTHFWEWGGGGGGQNKVSRLEKEQLDCNYVLDKEE